MPDRMSEHMSHKLSEYIEYMSKYTSLNVMLGITRSKVIQYNTATLGFPHCFASNLDETLALRFQRLNPPRRKNN